MKITRIPQGTADRAIAFLRRHQSGDGTIDPDVAEELIADAKDCPELAFVLTGCDADSVYTSWTAPVDLTTLEDALTRAASAEGFPIQTVEDEA
jgi:hypothetical protein